MFPVPFALCLIFRMYLLVTAGRKCKPAVASVNGQALKDHKFKTSVVRTPFDCQVLCESEITCQSYNYVIAGKICELNNRTKEARPESFVADEDRFYVKNWPNRVPLGSIPELPSQSCTEIKASEGEKAISGKYWLDSIIPGKVVLAHCDMQTEDIDECSVNVRFCDINASCINTHGSYKCLCHAGFTGDGQICTAVNCSEYPVGISSPDIIPDNQMTTSSYHTTNYSSYQAYNGRLHDTRGDGWCSAIRDSNNDWLQVDFAKKIQVCSVATQGDVNGNEWVIDFKLSYSSDGNTWTIYKDGNGADQVFHREGDSNTIDQHKLAVIVPARYLRFHPTNRHEWNCLRVEVYSDKPTE
ncbi:uncharacterized protein LOC144665303 [Oculina patagonica]